MSINTKPHYLFIVGAPKAGTTSLAAQLDQSDHITLAIGKEPSHFTDFGMRDWTGPGAEGFKVSNISDWPSYDALFAHKPGTAWRLDASTDYLSCDASPDLIATFAKDHQVKVVAVLRDPVERIISEFQHTLRDGMQSGTLAASLAAEKERAAKNMHPLFQHIKRSSYASQVARYRTLLGDNFMVLDFHTMNNDSARLQQITDFIDVPRIDTQATPQHLNRSYAPRSQFVSRLLRSRKLKSPLRLLVPKSVRSRIWRAAHKANQAEYKVTEAELAQLRQMLADEIAACEADPDIVTDHWHLARGDARQSA